MKKLNILATVVFSAAVLANGHPAGAAEESNGLREAGLVAGAAAANVLPVVSAVEAPTCLQGYILCKLTFAGLSLVAAAENVVMTGGANPDESAAIVRRGFSGDWYLTPAHIAGERTPDPYPDLSDRRDLGGAGAHGASRPPM